MIVRSLGVDRVLITCDEDNVGLSMVIERCGGVLDPTLPLTSGAPPKRRYWIS